MSYIYDIDKPVLRLGKMSYLENEKKNGQGMKSVDCGYGIVVNWTPPKYPSIDEIYDEVISECNEQSCRIKRAEHRFEKDDRYTDEDIMAQRAMVNEYGDYARLHVIDAHDRIISPHGGEKVAIISEARHYNPKTFGTQWRVRLEDGTITVAFFDELERA